MTISQINEVLQAAMLVALKVAAPILIVSISLGLIVSILQAATQIHEQTLTFVPKLVAIGVILVILGPWMFETMNDFTMYIFRMIAKLS
ncbi:flagellar biosynthesis protein FliQ [Caproiciproducens galactitolivorans]|jgi:flagellar biosynthesis protein FliQ|uniref:Flagellar biosynthetic protein FliQ n=1 Tax=Caproiciproducens galactitolivorans TaxID=642589 RepID=A0A4Z0Y2G0_9FIRM|nr:flagellar biosynthesis protein FliQ [Caproiciproducens galactitolivorans]QEY34330.1 flagellar biosynthesis protein FliQ [Caproiciproducens galactitolivorans]TGJ77904.1 flagellar biosynthetic protein FliQ [Caproiciproducens galactitolivorans]